MLVAVSVCPHPPLLVPELATGAAVEIADLRAACLASVRRLGQPTGEAGVVPPVVVVVGSASEDGAWGGEAGGDLRGFGCDVAFGGPDRVLPTALTIGAHLLDQIGWPNVARRYVAVADHHDADTCAARGRSLVQGPEPVALLVMGDGSAKRTTQAPGYLDPRAIDFDETVLQALEKADADALLSLDPALAADLWVAGRAAWQVLAGAAQAAYDDGASITTAVRYDEAPYGVGYAVVDWRASRPEG